jgi:hypothetical protein
LQIGEQVGCLGRLGKYFDLKLGSRDDERDILGVVVLRGTEVANWLVCRKYPVLPVSAIVSIDRLKE